MLTVIFFLKLKIKCTIIGVFELNPRKGNMILKLFELRPKFYNNLSEIGRGSYYSI